jgi:molecular chaperone GrpE
MNDRPCGDAEGLIERFRRWLEEVRDQAADLGSDGPHAGGVPGEDADRPGPEFGLVDLVEEFTALRHELKLQTKSGRGLIDQAESMVAALRQAIEYFRSVEPKESQAAWAAGKPLAEALGDLDEALDRGRREIERISRRLGEDSTLALADAIDERFRRQSWLRRLLTADFHRQVQNVVHGDRWLRRDMLEALLEGYGLIHARLARVMASEQVERIPCEGRPVDPERMIVIEVVDDPERMPGTVVKELRSGYTWRGRLLRYAEVQAASGASGAALSPAVGAEDQDFDDEGPDESEGNGDLDRDPDEDGDDGLDLDLEPGGSGAGRPHPH